MLLLRKDCLNFFSSDSVLPRTDLVGDLRVLHEIDMYQGKEKSFSF